MSTDTYPLHEMSFPVTVRATTNVNSIEPELVLAWLLHKADLAGNRDQQNRHRFLSAAKAVAAVYSYLPLAQRALATGG